MYPFDEKYNYRRAERCCSNCKHGEPNFDGEAKCFHPERPLGANGKHMEYVSEDCVCDAWEKKEGGAK